MHRTARRAPAIVGETNARCRAWPSVCCAQDRAAGRSGPWSGAEQWSCQLAAVPGGYCNKWDPVVLSAPAVPHFYMRLAATWQSRRPARAKKMGALRRPFCFVACCLHVIRRLAVLVDVEAFALDFFARAQPHDNV